MKGPPAEAPYSFRMYWEATLPSCRRRARKPPKLLRCVQNVLPCNSLVPLLVTRKMVAGRELAALEPTVSMRNSWMVSSPGWTRAIPPPKRSTSEMPSSTMSVEPTFMPWTRGLPPPSTPGVRVNRLVMARPLSGSCSMRRASFTSPTSMPSVVITGATPVTSTVASRVPTSMVGSTTAVWPASSVSVPDQRLKPVTTTASVYRPGGTALK